jgi:hypothetical protein
VCLQVVARGDAAPRAVYVAQHEHTSFTLHTSSSAAHAEETASVDWPAVLPTKGAGFLAFALKGFALRLEPDGALRAYLPGALQPALAAGGYRVDEALTDADGNIVGGRLQYRPKLRGAALAQADGTAQAAVRQAADASAHAMAMLREHADAVQPLLYADVDLLKQRLAAAHPAVAVLAVVGRDAMAVASMAAARAQQLAARTEWHAGAAEEASAHLRAAQQACRAATADTTPPGHAPGKRRQRGGEDADDELARLNQRLLAGTMRAMHEAATRRMWSLLHADFMCEQWDTADWLAYARGARTLQLDLVQDVFLRHAKGRGRYAAKMEGRGAVAALAAAEPSFAEDVLKRAHTQDDSDCGPGGAAARQRAVGLFEEAVRHVMTSKRATPELVRIAETPLDTLPYAAVVALLIVLLQAAEDAGRAEPGWRDAVLAHLNGADDGEAAEPVRKRPRRG